MDQQQIIDNIQIYGRFRSNKHDLKYNLAYFRKPFHLCSKPDICWSPSEISSNKRENEFMLTIPLFNYKSRAPWELDLLD